MIKAVIFDFYGVISSDEYWNFVKEDKEIGADFGQLADNVNIGKTTWQELIKTVAEKTGQSPETVNKMYESQAINPAMIAFIDKLHKNYKTALLTNANQGQFEPIAQKAGLNKIFDEVVISSKLGIIKPDPRIFKYTLKKLNLLPNQAVFVDDLSKHIQGAQALGIHTIKYETFSQMKRDLEELLAANSNN